MARVASVARVHGDVTPQAVDIYDVPQLGEGWRSENTFSGHG
jgi:hypothetical protein